MYHVESEGRMDVHTHGVVFIRSNQKKSRFVAGSPFARQTELDENNPNMSKGQKSGSREYRNEAHKVQH